jgi:threonyl-tRNA synthetase
VLTVTDRDLTYARELEILLQRAGLRVEVDAKGDKINFKIAEAERLKIPYMLVVGSREAEQRTVSVRRHGEGNLGAVPLDQALTRIKEEANVPG